MNDANKARIEIFRKGDSSPMATSSFDAISSTQLMSVGKKMLDQDSRADYVYIFWQGRRLTVDRNTKVMGAH